MEILMYGVIGFWFQAIVEAIQIFIEWTLDDEEVFQTLMALGLLAVVIFQLP